jgi:hypothetical protein
MTSDRDDEIANPKRTKVEDESDLAESTNDTPPEQKQDSEHDPHDQPWRTVAREVREAVENADGPLEGH